VQELVELLDGPLGQGARGVFAEAAASAGAVLAAVTVADVADREAKAAGAPMYHI
jgi:Rrf2 family transcriptional regulator, cysteine metabolism repressor